MELSSPRFKSLVVTAGASFWFFIILTALNSLNLEVFITFVVVSLILTQVFTVKLSGALDVFAIINTKVFLGIIFVFFISLYGVFFKILRIDLLRLKRQNSTYWLPMEQLKESRIFKQY